MPEFWGKDSPYHPGTSFLGTPPDHLEVLDPSSMSAVLADKGGPLQTRSMLQEPELLAVLPAASEPTLTLLLVADLQHTCT